MWLENLGFAELRTAFTGNKMDGVALKGLTLEKLAEDYGVSDEDQRKKIYYNLKDVLRKDNSSGNTNHYSQMLFWLLPFLAIGKWLSLKYDKQIARATKRYKKWQEVRKARTMREATLEALATRGRSRLCSFGPLAACVRQPASSLTRLPAGTQPTQACRGGGV